MNATINKYAYETVSDDSLNVRIYTLPNGLKLYLSVNKAEPRIFTNIVVRAGSKQDPPDTTGLAHYMEHMLFKGTSRIGALQWDEEKKLLEQISDLYEAHRNTKDLEERKKIYAKIDQISFDAAKLVAPNEYDKLATALGAKGTNAYTWVEQTVYVNDIPSNELERWLKLESERFQMMALRLFHTELETVYEEFNISQDKDFRKSNNAIRAALFPKHPYGTRTTLGTGEDLKNPSQKKIQKYFSTYYVPNNMGIILSGDFDPDQVVGLVEQYFGNYEYKEVPPFKYEEQPQISAPVRKEVFGQEAASMDIA
ncbi:MAG: insulinase family protein, partial [Bacteroidota bacterium]